MKERLRGLLLIGTAILLSACGIVADDEERLVKAIAEIEAGQYRAAMIDLKNILRNDGSNAEVRYLLAKVMLGLGDIPSAEKEVRLAIEYGADSSEASTLQLNVLLAKGEYNSVLQMTEAQASVLAPDTRWSMAGAAYFGLRDYESSSAEFEQWRQADSTAFEPIVGLAKVLSAQQKHAEAEALLEIIGGDAAGNPQVLYSVGVVKRVLGKYVEARAAFEQAVAGFKPQTGIFQYIDMLTGLIDVELSQLDTDSARIHLDMLGSVAPGHPSTLFLEARIAQIAGDDALAARHLQTLLSIAPNHVPAQLALAGTHMSLGNVGQSEALLHRVLSVDPGNISARAQLARVQIRRLDPSSAVEILSPLLVDNVGDARLYNVLAQASIQKGEMDDALELLRTAADVAADDFESKINLAAAYLLVDKPEETLKLVVGLPDSGGKNYRREELQMMALVALHRADDADAIASALAQRIDSGESAIVVASNHFIRAGDLEAAAGLLERYAESNPTVVPTVRAQMGLVALRRGTLGAASAHFRETLSLQQDNLDAMLGLAHIYELEGSFEKQKQILWQAVRSHHQAIVPRALLAERLLDEGLASEAVDLADEIVRLGWGRAEIGELVATVYSEVGRYDDAMVQYRALKNEGSMSASAQMGIARAQLGLGDTSLARTTLRELLDDSPEWVPALVSLALIEIGQERHADASSLISRYRQVEPGSAGSFLLEGELLFQQGDYERSADALREAGTRGAGRAAILREFQVRSIAGMEAPESVLMTWLSENQNDDLSRKFLAQYYQSIDRSEEAAAEYLRILALQPDDYAVMNNLAWHYQNTGALESALTLAERAYELAPNSGSIADTLGWIYFEIGQFDKSARILGDASRLSPDNGEIQYHYAAVLSQLGRKDEARQVLQAVEVAQLRYPSQSLAEKLMREL